MFRVLADGDDTHRLEDAEGVAVGWIRGRVIGLRGLDDEQQATAVAIAAWRALTAALRRQFGGWPRYEPALDRLRVVHDGVHEWISDGTAPIARLVREEHGAARERSHATAHAAAQATTHAGPLAIEFELPSFASEGIAVSAAQLMGRAFQECVAAGARS